MNIRSDLFATALAAASLLPGSVLADDLTPLLECRDASVFHAVDAHLAEAARAQGFVCREYRRQRETSLECSAGGRAMAFGRSVKEFLHVHSADGATTLSVVFNDPPNRIETLLAKARETTPGNTLLATARVDEREDGVAELRCTVPGSRSATGSLAGRLDFRGVQPIPAMRVCAAPIENVRKPHCVETAPGRGDYLIENLPAGDYYVTAFALEKNPNRLFGAYTSTLARCRSTSANGVCPDQLQPVTVFPDDVRSGVDPVTLMRELPYPLRTAGPGSKRPSH